MKIEKVYIYGAGDAGIILANQIQKKKQVLAFIDKDIQKQKNGVAGLPVIPIDAIKDKDALVVVTPTFYFGEVLTELMEYGVDRNSVISIRQLLGYAFKYKQNRKDIIPEWPLHGKKPQWQFLITGAAFVNKGAQSMLFTTAMEIKKRFKNAVIYFCPAGQTNIYIYTEEIQNKYPFHFLLDGEKLHSEVFDILPNLTAIVDVSGYALSSNWDSSRYFMRLRLAKKYNVPLYIMPQSFGPFDYDKETIAELQELLAFARVIYPRERDGFELLTEKLRLQNVKLSDDLVLQNKGMTYLSGKNVIVPQLLGASKVAIIPNIRNFTFGEHDQIMQMYYRIINKLLAIKKKVYILAHSDDQQACREIKELFLHCEDVVYIEKEMDCFEYEMLVKQFDFVIASRYHAIVHAYKQNVPCIAVGWAEKYSALAKRMKQETYVFDVRNELCCEKIEQAIIRLNSRINREKEILAECLQNVQTINCFACLDELVE